MELTIIAASSLSTWESMLIIFATVLFSWLSVKVDRLSKQLDDYPPSEMAKQHEDDIGEIHDIIWFPVDEDYDGGPDPSHIKERFVDLRDDVGGLLDQNDELEKRIETLESWVRHLGPSQPPNPN